MLKAAEIFEDCGLPCTIGGARLEAAWLERVLLVAPFKGQMMAVADALRPLIGVILPPAGQLVESGGLRVFWRQSGQWQICGEAGLMRQTHAALMGKAAVADASDQFGMLELTGGTAALTRLCALDLEGMQAGEVAQTSLADIPVTLMVTDTGYRILLPRSYAGSVVERLKLAMQSTAARSMIT